MMKDIKNKLVGVTSQSLLAVSLTRDEELKRAALLFDEIALYGLYRSSNGKLIEASSPRYLKDTSALRYFLMPFSETHDYFEDEQFSATLDWLREKEVVIEPELDFTYLPIAKKDDPKQFSRYIEILRHIKALYENSLDFMDSFIHRLEDMHDGDSETITDDHPFSKLADTEFELIQANALRGTLGARLLSLQLREKYCADAYPFASLPFIATEPFLQGKAETINIILSVLPLPDGLTPWESILDFREDDDFRKCRWGLRAWMSDVARGQLSAIEIKERIEWLSYQHEKLMKIHKIKAGVGVLETIVTSTAEVIENLLQIRFEKAARSLFSFKRARLSLMEAEIASPGKEVAYIFKVREQYKTT